MPDLSNKKVFPAKDRVKALGMQNAVQQIGKIIDRVGYKIVMVSDTLILVIGCFFYGFAHHIFPLCSAFATALMLRQSR